MNIIQRLIPKTMTDRRPGLELKPEFITIHETDNTSKGANAEAHARLQERGNDRTASWHYQVDDHQVIQSIPDNEVAWAAGDGRNGPGNRKSIHVEMCVNADGDYEKTLKNTLELVHQLMEKWNITLSKVVPHQHWTGKNCPRNLLPKWDSFIKQLSKNGWAKENSQWFFYENGRKKTGWVKDNGKWYYLEPHMKTGWIKDKDEWYLLADNGVMLTGFQKIGTRTFYLKDNGAMLQPGNYSLVVNKDGSLAAPTKNG